MEILSTQYAWESASDTSASWRIGDGTSAFYNYVYYSVAGFTESDTFKSNQIRASVLNSTSAMNLVERENIPRIAAIQVYSAKIGVTSEYLFNSIHSMKKL